MSIIIEEANARHLPEIGKMEREIFPDSWSEYTLKTCILDPEILFPVARIGDKLLGYAILQLIPPEAELQNIAVRPGARRSGIGRALLTHLIRAGRTRGVEAIHLEVRASNGAAIALYQSLGFLPVRTRPAYYESPREDALIMTRPPKGESSP